MLKVKLGSISSSLWLAMILIGALPTVLCLESGHRKKGTIKYCGGTTNLTYYQDGLGDVSSWICQSSYGYFSNLLLYLYHALQ